MQSGFEPRPAPPSIWKELNWWTWSEAPGEQSCCCCPAERGLQDPGPAQRQPACHMALKAGCFSLYVKSQIDSLNFK